MHRQEIMEHGSCVPQGTEIVRAGFHYTLSLIGGKYKMAILYLLAEHRVLRHNAIHRRIAGIPYKTLAVVLKELAQIVLLYELSTRRCRPKWSIPLWNEGDLSSRFSTVCVTGESSIGMMRITIMTR